MVLTILNSSSPPSPPTNPATIVPVCVATPHTSAGGGSIRLPRRWRLVQNNLDHLRHRNTKFEFGDDSVAGAPSSPPSPSPCIVSSCSFPLWILLSCPPPSHPQDSSPTAPLSSASSLDLSHVPSVHMRRVAFPGSCACLLGRWRRRCRDGFARVHKQ